MTTITLEKNIALPKNVFKDAKEMLIYFIEYTGYNFMDFKYEEYLENKMLEAKDAPETDFVNL